MSVTPVRHVSRRAFVSQGTCAFAAVACGLTACASVSVRRVIPVGGLLSLDLSDYPELTKTGGAARLQLPGEDVSLYVLAVSATEFVALSPRCTHLGCTVEIQGKALVCPCHGSTFDQRGGVVRGPAQAPLRRFDVTRGDRGQLIIALGERG